MIKHRYKNSRHDHTEIKDSSVMRTDTNQIFKTGFVLNDKWVIIEFIGKGAMGEVYRAHQLNLKRDVAIKVISQEMLQSYEEDSEEIEIAYQRFRREVQAMARIRHLNVLQIFDYGSETLIKEESEFTVEYIVMEYIPGATFQFTMPEEGLFPEADLIKNWLEEYFLPLLDGVEAIHSGNIIHRDLKPENILMDGDIPKIADFGIARSSLMKSVTQSIDIKGTPAYMSPEHFFDFKNADQQSDIYSLGKILFEAISGKIGREKTPFKCVHLSNPDTPFLKKLDQIIQESTAEEKEKRFKSVSEIRNALLESLSLFDRGPVLKALKSTGRFSFLRQPRFIWTGLSIVIFSAAAIGLWHHIKHNESLETFKRVQPAIEEAPTSSRKPSDLPAESIRGKDGIIMRFIPGGNLTIQSLDSAKADRAVQMRPFYLDKNKVTNHHFVEFLNAIKATLTISGGIVKKKDHIWLYLGVGNEPQDQIIYENGRFYLREIEYAAFPVVRVTWYGAAAYASHYNKRLLTEYEWKYLNAKNLVGDVTGSSEKETLSAPDQHTHMMSLPPGSEDAHMKVTEVDKGTNGTAHPMPSPQSNDEKYRKAIPKEWITQAAAVFKKRLKEGVKGSEVYNSLVAGTSIGAGRESINYRYPWEAFADVGFRCDLSFKSE